MKRKDKYLRLREMILEDFGSIRKFESETGIHASTVSCVINGRRYMDKKKHRQRIEKAYRKARPERDLSGVWENARKRIKQWHTIQLGSLTVQYEA